MKIRNLVFIVVVGVVALIVFYSFQGKDLGRGYEVEIKSERTAKNEFMHASDESPFGDQKKDFKALNYYPIDLKYRISANLVAIPNKKVMVLPTSDGLEKKYLEYGYVQFELDGVTNKLLLLEIIDDGPYHGTLFLAFADATSAHETYGAGRYLDLKKIPGASSILLDFNQAYNPYCAYSENFSCPFPPTENILRVAVRAGEKKYHE